MHHLVVPKEFANIRLSIAGLMLAGTRSWPIECMPLFGNQRCMTVTRNVSKVSLVASPFARLEVSPDYNGGQGMRFMAMMLFNMFPFALSEIVSCDRLLSCGRKGRLSRVTGMFKSGLQSDRKPRSPNLSSRPTLVNAHLVNNDLVIGIFIFAEASVHSCVFIGRLMGIILRDQDPL